MISELRALVRISRPYYVIQAIAPPVAGYASASHDFSFLTAAAVGSIFGMLAMAAWAANDLLDSDLDSQGTQKRIKGLYVAGGTGSLLKGNRNRLQRIAIVYVSLLIFVALGLATMFSWWFLILAVCCGLVGILYSLPPIRLKSRGLFGAAVISFSYGLAALAAGCIAGGGRIGASNLLFGAVMSILVFGYDALGHIIDYEDDKANGLKTVVVQLGNTNATRLLAACQVFPILGLCSLGIAGLLTIRLTGAAALLGVTVCTAILLLSARNQRHFSILRLISVPLLSLSFFLLR